MKADKLILTLSVIVVLISSGLLFITLEKYGITGFATDIAGANLSITAFASVAFTDDNCSFGNGSVNETPEVPFSYAYVYSNGTATINGTGWSTCTDGLKIQNDGNINVSVNFTADIASTFIGGNAPGFKVIATTTSCTGGAGLTTLTEVTGTGQPICADWPIGANATINFEIKIPENAVGNKGTIVTATALA